MGDWSVVPAQPAASDWSVVPANAPAPALVPAQAPGTLEAIGRGALQGASLGFSDELSGAIESLFSKKSYTQARDEARANNAAASDAHPWAYGGGELAGGLAGAIVPGAALAKGAALAGEGTALARGLGGAAKVAQLATGAAPEGAGLANVAARSALTGGVAGLGGSDADTLAGTAKDVGVGALAGGLTGAALHGVGSAISKKAPESFEHDLNSDIFKKSRPTRYIQASKVQEASPEAFKEMAYSKDFANVQKLARSGKIEEARDAAQGFVDKASANRLSNYEAATSGGTYQADVGSVVNRLTKEASALATQEGEQLTSKAVSTTADNLRNTLKTIHIDSLKEGDTADNQAINALKKYLPDQTTLTKQDFINAAKEADKAQGGTGKYGNVPDALSQAIENLPFRYDPEAKISLLRLRKITTSAQEDAVSALGTIDQTRNAKLASSVSSSVNDALEHHLDAAAKSSPQAAKAVQRIRHDDRIISMGLAVKDGLQTRLEKESIGKGGTLGNLVTNGLGGIAKLEGIHSLMSGNIGKAAMEFAAPQVIKAAGQAARVGNDTLARFIYAASQGNPFAIKTLNTLRATPAGAARIAGLMAHQAGSNL